ncbi:MAG TPA: RagB/SusD family nutrient uptake outer membrane protein [Prolixibacteraceae bacterium]|nr:RagB/SusD family nutrient uptake outer membrane protein [Prolixibacteraceae bacterium]
MKKFLKIITLFLPVLLLMGAFSSCEQFFNPDQDITINEENLYTEWYEYRSAAMGLYSLQQDLVEQIVILGELRGDLLKVTENATPELVEIYNFNISKENKYASPKNFFKLIAATNRLISILEDKQPNVLDKAKPVNNYDRLYGEALCMRAWAYFNAVRIYGKVPLVDSRVSTIEDIEAFIESPVTYTIPVYVKYGLDGYTNDTIYDQQIVLEKKYLNTEQIIRYFTQELEEKVKAVGVNHYIDNDDNSWEVTIWSNWSYNTLLGHMYLTLGDLYQSSHYFEKVLYNGSENYRYQLDESFAFNQWGYIFTNIDSREHILTLSFNKSEQQQNGFQRLFEPFGSNEFMLKPTVSAVHAWETQWRGYKVINDYTTPDSSKTVPQGMPSDYYRGYGFSYIYAKKNGEFLDGNSYLQMLDYKKDKEQRSVESIMDGLDTIVVKYSLNKTIYDQDANFIIYRAGGVNLYLAEAYNYLRAPDAVGDVRPSTYQALNIINNGSNYNPINSRAQLGIRGRVGLPALVIQDIKFIFDPFTNKVIGHLNLQNNLSEKQRQFENEIMDERVRELAFEGERFYDLMRVAKRRNDPSFLATKVAAKYPAAQRDYFYNFLMNENNWYINYFE